MALDQSTLLSRRSVLAGTIGGLAALAAAAIGRPAPARANDPNDVVLGGTNDETTRTTIRNFGSGDAIYGYALSGGTGLRGYSLAGDGVFGGSGSGNGVNALASGAGATSIYGSKENSGVAVWGEILDPTSGSGAVFGSTRGSGPGVIGENIGTGVAVYGQSAGPQPSIVGEKLSGHDGVAVQGTIGSGGWTAVYGVTSGSGVGVVGESTSSGAGTWGVAAGTGDGVFGRSALGRGGHFKGKKAQIRLDPSTAATHPASGAAGDIFLDKSKRLWLCKGGTSWKRLDL